jgi:lysylphosphatidylglycerol synthetase-like protein (DUF2156 family)
VRNVVQLYLITITLCIVIGWLLRDFFISYNITNLYWALIFFIIVLINEKTAIFKKSKKRIAKSKTLTAFFLLVFLILIIMFFAYRMGFI